MTTAQDIRTLLTFMPPFGAAGEPVDAHVIDDLAGELPDDYVVFLKAFGAGQTDGDGMRFLVPEAIAGPKYHGFVMEDESLAAQDVWDDRWAAESRPGEAPKLVAWGVDSMPFVYCWIAEDEDPNRWPIQVVDQRGPGLQVNCGMVEFLVAKISGQLDGGLYGRPPKPAVQARRFIQRREEQRHWAAGRNPWSPEATPLP